MSISGSGGAEDVGDGAGEVDGDAELLNELVNAVINNGVVEASHADEDPQDGVAILGGHVGGDGWMVLLSCDGSWWSRVLWRLERSQHRV